MCETFGCLPDEAERQDPQLVRRIIQYRNAKLAVSWFNEPGKGIERLQEHPALVTLLTAMREAQGVTDAPDALFPVERDEAVQGGQ